MEKNRQNFTRIRNAFNNIKIMRGQLASIATADSEGVPNVAPIGSARVVDDDTVHVLQGYLSRTYSNLRQNPRATFGVVLKSSIWDTVNMLKDRNDDVMGYRLYCQYVDSDDNPDVLAQEFRQISNRMPRLLRRVFLRFARQHLKRLLVFKIDSVRVVGGPEVH